MLFFCECHVAQAAPKFLNLLLLPPKCWNGRCKAPSPSMQCIVLSIFTVLLAFYHLRKELESCVPPPTVNLFPVSEDLLILETVT